MSKLNDEQSVQMEYLTVPVPRILKMNSPMTPVSEDDETGLGFHHTLVSF
jgi:hypothetical protein